MKATYRRWECACRGQEGATVEIEVGERPATLPAVYPWPPSVLGCDCGGTLNLVDVSQPAAAALLAACQRVADAEKVLLGILDRHLPGWRRGYLFEEMFAEVRAAIAKAETE